MPYRIVYALGERLAILIFMAGMAIASPALAISGGGSSSGGSTTPSCKAGEVWSAKTQKCEPKTSSRLDDKTLYAQGRDLALAGPYREALDALGGVKNKDSMTLTMVGYATRKMGNYDQGLDYYRQALALDANNVNAREYLGEAYAEKGHVDLAKAELVKVAALCGTGCEQYRDLSAAISGNPGGD